MSTRGYWPRPWTGEDGGPRRRCAPEGQAGLGIGPGERLEVAAARQAFATDVLVRREPGELYALRHDMPLRGPFSGDVEGWVERLDPETLDVTATTPRLPAGRWWPGGVAAHACGDLHMVLGRWAHRLSSELDVIASRRLPVPRPHNSFVVLDGGELVTKDCDAPAGHEPATVSVLDPLLLEPVAAPLRLPEPCIARLASDGESVYAVGTTEVFRLRLDRDAERVVVDERWRPRYGPEPDRSYGWDPVIAADHLLWMDNGRNAVDHTMLGSGDASGPVRLWWARLDDGETRSAEITGLPHGTESNPPAWDPERGVVVAYDSGNGGIRGWRLAGDEMKPLWRRDDIAHACHLIVFPDTREIVAGDWRDLPLLRHPLVRPVGRALGGAMGRSPRVQGLARRRAHDRLVVLDLDTGAEKARVDIPTAMQSFNFPAPGFDRDVYYQSMTTIARVRVV